MPAELIAGLARRGMVAVVVTDTPAAMVRLARAGAAAILLAAGAQLPGHHELLEAIGRYHPATGCWEYSRTDGAIRLNRLRPTSATTRGAETAPRAEAAPPAPAAGAGPTGNGKRRPLDDIVLHLPGAAIAPSEPLVTEEELAMLLGSGAGSDPA